MILLQQLFFERRSFGSEEMNPEPIGTATTQSFLDDFSLTGGPPGQGARFYRIEVVR